MAKRMRGSKGIEWTRVMSERLCEAYETEEMLYTVQHELYHNKDARLAAWKRIAVQLGVTAEDARARMDNMRTQYLRFKKIQPNENGFVSSTHWLVGKLHFLDDYLKTRSGSIVTEQYQSGSVNVVLDDDGEMVDAAAQLWDYSNTQSMEDSDEASSQFFPDQSSVLQSPRQLFNHTRTTANRYADATAATVQSTTSEGLQGTGSSSGVRSVGAFSNACSDVRNSLEILNNAVSRMTEEVPQWQTTQQPATSSWSGEGGGGQQPAAAEDVHDAFAKYIAFELRQGGCNPQALTACKREIFAAISRLQDACNSRVTGDDNRDSVQRVDVELKTER